MKTAKLFFVLFIVTMNSYGQELSSDFKIIPVNKKIKEFPDKFDLSSPLNSCISINYLFINGKDYLLRTASTVRKKAYLPDINAPDSKVLENDRNYYLNSTIKEVIFYKDSVAGVTTQYKDSLYTIRTFTFENSKWVNCGEDVRNSILESRKQFAKYADQKLCVLRRIKIFTVMPQDTLSFINYLKNHEQEPKEFVLTMLAKYKIVIYAELYRRVLSWNLCRSIIRDTAFQESAGTVFLEVPAHKQNDLDNFNAKDTINKELLLNVLRETSAEGMHDKGMYDFIVDIWKINKTLPSEKRIKIIAVDIPRPYSKFKSVTECMNYFDTVMDRNKFMTSIIEKYIKLKKDNRNCLFIVGEEHVCKSSESAGSILSKTFPEGGVFTIFTHCPVIDNSFNIPERIRNGIFDYSFYMNGNKPIGFLLKDSPFGKEPFDGDPEISYNCKTGSFADNYDGYIFFGSLDTEPCGEILYELYSDDFVKELNRRASLFKTTLQDWWGIKEVSKEAVISNLKETEGKNRWGTPLPPLFDKTVP